MFTFTVQSGSSKETENYRHFRPMRGPVKPEEAVCCALVWNEGSPDLWWLDDKLLGTKELRRFYIEQDPWLRQIIIHLFPIPEQDDGSSDEQARLAELKSYGRS